MNAHSYELTDAVAGFAEGDVLDVTARFGDWHSYSLKLEPSGSAVGRSTVVVTESHGFSESEILDETARFGDWHEYELGFDPGERSRGEETDGRVYLSADELARVAEPVGSTA